MSKLVKANRIRLAEKELELEENELEQFESIRAIDKNHYHLLMVNYKSVGRKMVPKFRTQMVNDESFEKTIKSKPVLGYDEIIVIHNPNLGVEKIKVTEDKKLSVKDIEESVIKMDSVEDLKKMLENETRVTAIKAIEDRINDLESDDKGSEEVSIEDFKVSLNEIESADALAKMLDTEKDQDKIELIEERILELSK